MWLLVDYGNVDLIQKRRGLHYVVETLVNRIGPTHLKVNQTVNVRLYDGWYDGIFLTRHAQDIATQIGAFSPSPICVRGHDQNFWVKVNVELARSLLSIPSKDMLHTFRIRGFPSGLKCETPPFDNCVASKLCPWKKLPDFLRHRKCPTDGCELHPKNIIYKAEQKIVDTMLTSDMIEIVLRNEEFVIASSDDDMLPGICLALSRGASVIHLQTKRGQTTPQHYVKDFSTRYTQIKAN